MLVGALQTGLDDPKRPVNQRRVAGGGNGRRSVRPPAKEERLAPQPGGGRIALFGGYFGHQAVGDADLAGQLMRPLGRQNPRLDAVEQPFAAHEFEQQRAEQQQRDLAAEQVGPKAQAPQDRSTSTANM